MAQDKQVGNDYVRKSTMLTVAFIAMVAGFLGGVVFTVYKSGAGPLVKTSPPVQDADQDHKHTTEEQAEKISALEEETRQNPENVEAWIQLGNIYFDTNMFKKSVSAYEKALDLDPDNANVLTDLGVMYRRSGQPDKAVEAFDKAIKTDPRHEVSRFNKGIVLMHDLKDFEGAIRAWEELVKVNPSAMTASGQTVKEMIKRMKEKMKD